MKILLINECHYPRGGADIVYLNTGRLLESYGHEVHYFSIKSEKNISCPDESYFFEKPKNALAELFSFFYNRKAAKALDRMIRVIHPDVAHVHLLWGVLTPSVLKVLKLHHIPVVHTVHDYLMACPVNHFLDKEGNICERCKEAGYTECIRKRCYKGKLLKSIILTTEYKFRNRYFEPSKFFDGIVFVSEFSRRKHLEHKERLSNITNIVLYNCTKDQGRPTSVNNGYYLYFGRLSDEKGVEVLIKAFLHTPQLHLKIVGDGPLRKSLEELAANAENIEFLGYKRNPELSDLIRGSKYVIIPSRCYENNPMTIVEAYSLGRPVIGSRIGGIPEIIDEHRTGYTFEMGNEDDLKDVVIRSGELGESDYERMVNNAYEFYKAHFSEENYYSTLVSFYETFINE